MHLGVFTFLFLQVKDLKNKKKGFQEIEVSCWSPVNDILSTQSDIFNHESMPTMTGGKLPPRELLTVRPSGTVFLQVNSIFRNLDLANAVFE